MCASVGRSLDNNNTIGLFSAFHGPQRRFREQTCKVVVVENHVTHRLSSSFHSTLTNTPSSPIAPAENTVWRRHWATSPGPLENFSQLSPQHPRDVLGTSCRTSPGPIENVSQLSPQHPREDRKSVV